MSVNVIQASLNPSSGEIKTVSTETVKTSAAVEGVKDAPAQTQEAPKQEATTPQPEKKTDPFSKGFAVMAKKERELRQRMAEMKAKEQKLAQEEAMLSQFKELKQKNPLEALQLLGMSYEDLVNYQLNGNTQPTTEQEVKQIKQQIQEYVEQQQEKERQQIIARQQAQERQTQKTIGDFKSQIGDFIKQKADQFELTSLEDPDAAVETIYETVFNHFKQTKQLLPLEKAAELFEEYLTEDTNKKRSAKKFSSQQTQGVRSPEAPKAAGNSVMERAMNVLNQGPKTLTNGMTASTSPHLAAPRLENDRIARALAALERKS